MTVSRHAATSRGALRGFTLIELLIVLAIAAVMALYAAQRLREQFDEQQAKAAADIITTVGKAVEAYIAVNSGTLPATPTDITIATLKTASLLPASFADSTPWGSPFNIRIRRAAGGPPYLYEALVISRDPWLRGGTPRIDVVGSAVRKIGAAGGMTYNATEGAVGLRGGWGPPDTTVANYPATNAAGKLAYYVNQASSPNDLVYLRRDGAFPMTGTLQMGGQAITAASDIAATGAISATGAITSAGEVRGNTVQSMSTMTAAGVVTAGGVSTTGAVNAGTVTASGEIVGGSVESKSFVEVAAGSSLVSDGRLHIQAGETLYLQPFSNASGSSTVVGGGGGSGNLTVENDINLTGLASRANAPTTTSVKALLPPLVELRNWSISAHNQQVAVPTCPNGGAPKVFILPHISTGTALGGKWGVSIRMTGPVGGYWRVEALDANGAAIPNPQVPYFEALVRTFCDYT